MNAVDASGRPTVEILDPPDYTGGAIERLVAPGTADFIHQDLDHWSVQSDGDRLWLGNDHGIYLYTPGAGLQKAYVFANNEIARDALVPAGFCR